MSLFNVVFAASGLVLGTLGSPPESISPDKSWHKFASEDPLLFIGRAIQIPSLECNAWMNALDTEPLGLPMRLGSDEKQDIQLLTQAWSPWKTEEKEIVSDCVSSPCGIKLSPDEVSILAETQGPSKISKSSLKLAEYLRMIRVRIQDYLKTEKRRSYEYSEKRFEPWDHFKEFKTPITASPSGKHQVWIRKLDFGSDRARPLHQVLDRQSIQAADSVGMTVWIQDVYTDHYFDSWGEWIQVICDSPKKGTLTYVHVLALEFDLLKKTDLISKLARGSMRSGIEKQGSRYLDHQFQRIQSRVKKQRK